MNLRCHKCGVGSEGILGYMSLYRGKRWCERCLVSAPPSEVGAWSGYAPSFEPWPLPEEAAMQMVPAISPEQALAAIGHKPAPDEPAAPPPHLHGKVIGFRGWTLDGYKLLSANRRQHGMHWEIGENKAVCKIDQRIQFLGGRDPRRGRPPAHEAPHPDCECGLYAYFEPRRENNPHNFRKDELIWGAVAAWGRIEVHADGFRAEYAQPVVLAYHPRQPYEDVIAAEAIASEWNLPFVRLDELPAEAEKHGGLVPEDMRPSKPPGFRTGGFMPGHIPGPARPQRFASPWAFTFAEVEQCAGELSASMAISKEEFERLCGGFGPTPKLEPESTGEPVVIKGSGPPQSGKHHVGDRVRDARGKVWSCVKPGQWVKAR